MGVNRAGFGITDDDIVQEAARQESIRRYFRYSCEYMLGLVDEETVQRAELIMEELGVGTQIQSTDKILDFAPSAVSGGRQ